MNDKEDVVLIFNRILFSHIKNEIMPFVATRIKLKIIIQNEVNHIDKSIYHIILLTCGIQKKKDTTELIHKKEMDP